ncbi:Hsp70 family protein [Streptomyces albireticuli]|uniref:Hsp70 family protein n=1 Tax=Streptomyces albireticuli TaxID=1940 RepID=UPI001180C61F|nr:hypothetical protein [Streptomyces albireticuli]MCD9194382.1 hypothetical protein [Streptomyces albireticuli]
MTDSSGTVIVGFDLGHGETALAKAYADKDSEPAVMDLGATGGGRQHVTMVAEHPTRGVLVGRAAMDNGATGLQLAFKSPELTREEVRRPTTLFVRKVSEDAVERDQDLKGGRRPVRWVFGAPSGWNRELRGEYAELLRAAGLPGVDVVPESRAALLYARESGEVEIDPGRLAGAVLVVDLGSSTTDFTTVLGHRTGPPLDTGLPLGAGLIDRTILEQQLDRNPQGEALRELLQEDRSIRLVLELKCREVKETFFRTDRGKFATDPEATVGTVYPVKARGGSLYFHIELTAGDMAAVLDTPQPSLDGRSWRQAYGDALGGAAAGLAGPPDAVLLTGGASRMHFVLEQTREAFGADRVFLGTEPEVAIARGLALAGRMSIRAAGFRADIRGLLDSDRVGSLVADRLPGLAEKLGEAVADGMTERHVIPAFRRWRAGQITTLDEMAAGISRALHAELTDPANTRLQEAIATWQNALRPDLEELTRPICRRRHLEPSAMALPAVRVSEGRLDVPVDAAAATEVLDNIASVVNVVVAGIVATTLFGAGTAIIAATGPFAVIVAFALLWAGLSEGKERALAKAREANIPPMARKVGGEARMVAKLQREAAAQEAALARAFGERFLEDGGQRLAQEISKGIAEDLEALADEAELLVR